MSYASQINQPWNRGFNESWLPAPYVHTDNLMRYAVNGVARYRQTRGLMEQVLMDRMLAFLQKRVEDKQPFFIYYAPYSIHGSEYADETRMMTAGARKGPRRPPFLPQPYYDTFMQREPKVDKVTAKIWALLAYFDDVLGRLLEFIDNSPLKDSTYVMVSGDNGPSLAGQVIANNPVKRLQRMPSGMLGSKNKVVPDVGSTGAEGAIRNHLAVIGPGVPAGHVDDTLLTNADILPTVAELSQSTEVMTHRPWSGSSFANLLVPGGTASYGQNERFVFTLIFCPLFNEIVWKDPPLLGPRRGVDKTQPMLQYVNSTGSNLVKGCIVGRWKEYKWFGNSDRVFRFQNDSHIELPCNEVTDATSYVTNVTTCTAASDNSRITCIATSDRSDTVTCTWQTNSTDNCSSGSNSTGLNNGTDSGNSTGFTNGTDSSSNSTGLTNGTDSSSNSTGLANGTDSSSNCSSIVNNFTMVWDVATFNELVNNGTYSNCSTVTNVTEISGPRRQELATRFNEAAREWWSGVLAEPYSFSKPVFQLGTGIDGRVTNVEAVGAVDLVRGRTVMSKTMVTNLTQDGDFLCWKVDVNTPGKYVVIALYKSLFDKVEARLSVGRYQVIVSRRAPSIVKTFPKTSDLKNWVMGSFTLPASESNQPPSEACFTLTQITHNYSITNNVTTGFNDTSGLNSTSGGNGTSGFNTTIPGSNGTTGNSTIPPRPQFTLSNLRFTFIPEPPSSGNSSGNSSSAWRRIMAGLAGKVPLQLPFEEIESLAISPEPAEYEVLRPTAAMREFEANVRAATIAARTSREQCSVVADDDGHLASVMVENDDASGDDVISLAAGSSAYSKHNPAKVNRLNIWRQLSKRYLWPDGQGLFQSVYSPYDQEGSDDEDCAVCEEPLPCDMNT